MWLDKQRKWCNEHIQEVAHVLFCYMIRALSTPHPSHLSSLFSFLPPLSHSLFEFVIPHFSSVLFNLSYPWLLPYTSLLLPLSLLILLFFLSPFLSLSSLLCLTKTCPPSESCPRNLWARHSGRRQLHLKSDTQSSPLSLSPWLRSSDQEDSWRCGWRCHINWHLVTIVTGRESTGMTIIKAEKKTTTWLFWWPTCHSTHVNLILLCLFMPACFLCYAFIDEVHPFWL